MKRWLIISFLLLAILGGSEVNSTPKRCILCHSMQPEYYTWLASSHGTAGTDCISCHSPPGVKGFLSAKWRGMNQIYSTINGSYLSPIQARTVISDSACERCHQNSALKVPGYGDIIMSHAAHKYNRIQCVKCHEGLTHGGIASRKVTFSTDYLKWDKTLGTRMMTDKEATKPTMDTCINCHRLRNAPQSCSGSCHKTSKKPASHSENGFREGKHGKISPEKLVECNKCHQYMTLNPITGFQDSSSVDEFLGVGKAQKALTAGEYSRVNIFCKSCHSKRPKSHGAKYIETHRSLATQDKLRCFTCHENQKRKAGQFSLETAKSITQSASTPIQESAQLDEKPPTSVACGSCHPSSHSESVQWKQGYHPVDMGEEMKITRYCYYCHREGDCSSCHEKIKWVKIVKEE